MIYSTALFKLISKRRCRKWLRVFLSNFIPERKTRLCLTHGKHGKKFLKGMQQMREPEKKKGKKSLAITERKTSHFQFPEPTCSSTGSKRENRTSTNLKALQFSWWGGLFFAAVVVFFIVWLFLFSFNRSYTFSSALAIQNSSIWTVLVHYMHSSPSAAQWFHMSFYYLESWHHHIKNLVHWHNPDLLLKLLWEQIW